MIYLLISPVILLLLLIDLWVQKRRNDRMPEEERKDMKTVALLDTCATLVGFAAFVLINESTGWLK